MPDKNKKDRSGLEWLYDHIKNSLEEKVTEHGAKIALTVPFVREAIISARKAMGKEFFAGAMKELATPLSLTSWNWLHGWAKGTEWKELSLRLADEALDHLCKATGKWGETISDEEVDELFKKSFSHLAKAKEWIMKFRGHPADPDVLVWTPNEGSAIKHLGIRMHVGTCVHLPDRITTRKVKAGKGKDAETKDVRGPNPEWDRVKEMKFSEAERQRIPPCTCIEAAAKAQGATKKTATDIHDLIAMLPDKEHEAMMIWLGNAPPDLVNLFLSRGKHFRTIEDLSAFHRLSEASQRRYLGILPKEFIEKVGAIRERVTADANQALDALDITVAIGSDVASAKCNGWRDRIRAHRKTLG